MDPTVLAAWIAAGVSALTLAGTLVAQYLGYRATSKDAEKTAQEQRTQLDRTLAEQRTQLDRTLEQQRDQLDRTLAEQNQQLDRTLTEQRTRTLNERFATAAGQLGDDKPAAVRLAGVYAMAGLADDWEANRQTCVDVLCGYLRMPYAPDPEGEFGPDPRTLLDGLAFQASREVRHTVIRVIAAHLKDGAPISWQGLNFDFTGVVFDGGSFDDARFSGGIVDFRQAKFSSGMVDFKGVKFSGAKVRFTAAEFAGGNVNFVSAEFSGGVVDFHEAKFSSGRVNFTNSKISGGEVRFGRADFCGAEVNFFATDFCGGEVDFGLATFSRSPINFTLATFSAGVVRFNLAIFSGSVVLFRINEFTGGEVTFIQADFSPGHVAFLEPRDWTSPPKFSWAEAPAGVKFAKGATQPIPS
jgi:uncharacterized protein YjbI with pentapeptide repeats